MIYLDKTTRKLQAVMAAGKTTSQPQTVVSFVDQNQAGITTKGATQVATLNDTTDVDICASPQSGFVRCIQYVSVANIDTVTNTISVKIDDGGTDTILIKAAVPTLKTLVYTDNGWSIVG